MKIEMLQSAAGPGFAYRPKQVVDHRPDSEAHAWVNAGVARPVVAESPIETAEALTVEAPPIETAEAPAAPAAAVVRRRRNGQRHPAVN